MSSNAWDEQPLNDELVGYLTPFNLYDPAMEGYSTFLPGQLYAEVFDIEVQTNNWGNTPVTSKSTQQYLLLLQAMFTVERPLQFVKKHSKVVLKVTDIQTTATHKEQFMMNLHVLIRSSTVMDTGLVTLVTQQTTDIPMIGLMKQ